ncbi:hypothetical protein SDC9_99430 [bioreactor metagenome]|uniref:Uncharacterized protein n=1 Tax=bioreactor metagenome TaxID=1076179 RepID=A0A645AHK5_9ZZZZ
MTLHQNVAEKFVAHQMVDQRFPRFGDASGRAVFEGAVQGGFPALQRVAPLQQLLHIDAVGQAGRHDAVAQLRDILAGEKIEVP